MPLTLLISEDPTVENEARLRQYLAELTLAQRNWEKDRLDVQRLSRAIQVLTGGSDPQTLLDPRFRNAIDARVQAEDDMRSSRLWWKRHSPRRVSPSRTHPATRQPACRGNGRARAANSCTGSVACLRHDFS